MNDPTNLLERTKVASTCAKKLNFTMPMLIDNIKDTTAKNYGGYPDRRYLVGKDGKVVYQGAPGPRGFKPDELEDHLKKLLGKAGPAK